MNMRYRKTDAGREAIRSRAASLSRPARNLLLIIDDARSGQEWLTLVAGATAADLVQLVANGFVAAAPQPAPLASVDLPLHGPSFDEALNALGYPALYALLISEAKARLGLIKGYKLMLDIEKCSGVDELRQLARRFVADLAVSHGAATASAARIAFGADH